MKFPPSIPLFGNPKWRGKCPPEDVELVSFFNRLRKEYPDSYGLIAFHPRNEGLRYHVTAMKHSAEGMAKGAADIIIPGAPSFVCEMKRMDHTKSVWQDGQIDYLVAAQRIGAFVCIALGAHAAWEAFEAWRIN